jgi:hypothetical protein
MKRPNVHESVGENSVKPQDGGFTLLARDLIHGAAVADCISQLTELGKLR